MRRGVMGFAALFDGGASVRIPLLQRGYAHGREGARAQAVRTHFVEALSDALAGHGPQPLDLDFVYGRWTDEGRVFEPLDGQQRLTTLFLLHRVVAWREGRQEALKDLLHKKDGCRFSYRWRPVTERFFKKLLAASSGPPAGTAPSKWLVDRPWFVQRWRRDPTVAGALVVLDALSAALEARPVPPGAWDRLVDPARCPVVFRLLPLRDFALSDALYIKMNARGKPLTDLEVFKARLEGWVGVAFDAAEPCPFAHPGEGWVHAVGRRFDGPWTDLLWRHRGESSVDAGRLDRRFQHLLRAVALWASVAAGAPDRVAWLVEHPRPAMPELAEQGVLDRAFLSTLVETLDLLCLRGPEKGPGLGLLEDRTWFDEDAHFERLLAAGTPGATGGVSALDWVLTWAWWAWLRAAGPPEGAEDQRRLGAWMRLVGNLAENSDIDRTDRLLAALPGLEGLLTVATGPDLLRTVASGLDLPGLDRRQQVEEQLKAQLLLRGTGWAPRLREAEAHPYFRGSVGFLLAFAGVESAWEEAGRQATWGDDQDARLRARFARRMAQAFALFDDHGRLVETLDPPRDRPFERALLAHGDYLLRYRANWSTLRTPKTTASWRRLLRADTRVSDAEDRRAVFGRLLAQVDPGDVLGSVRAALARARAHPDFAAAPLWRRLLVEHPALLARLPSGMLRWEDGTVYVLRGVQRNGTHVELHTFALFQWAREAVDDGRLAPFTKARYREVYGAAQRPALILVAPGGGRLEVSGWDGAFHAHLRSERPALPGWEVHPEGGLRSEAPFGQGEDALLALAAHLSAP